MLAMAVVLQWSVSCCRFFTAGYRKAQRSMGSKKPTTFDNNATTLQQQFDNNATTLQQPFHNQSTTTQRQRMPVLKLWLSRKYQSAGRLLVMRRMERPRILEDWPWQYKPGRVPWVRVCIFPDREARGRQQKPCVVLSVNMSRLCGPWARSVTVRHQDFAA